MIAYTVYVNEHYFASLYDSEHYGDRPEPYRDHEKTLWTMYQVSKNRGMAIVILDANKSIVFESDRSENLAAWIHATYPQFAPQIDARVYTRYPHPNDRLKRDDRAK